MGYIERWRAGLTGGLVLLGAGLVAGPPANATVRTGEINCTASTLLGLVSVRNPNTTHAVGPVWAATGSSVTIKLKGGLTVLPRTSGPGTIGGYDGLVNKAQLVGLDNPGVDTTMTTGAIPGLSYMYDPDLGDAVPAVPMNGVATYPHPTDGVLGPFAAPTVVVSGPLPLVGTPGTYDITTTLDAPGGPTLPTGSTPGNPGAGIYTPDVSLVITNVGDTDGSIRLINTSTTLTANIIAPIATAATTTCAPSTNAIHQVDVQTDGGPIVATAPVVACDPTNGTTATLSDSKGWWSKVTPPALINEFGGSLKGSITYDGCVAPDQRIAAWVPAKTGDAAPDAVALAKALISIKGKHYGNCTDVDLLTPTGRSYGGDTSTAYPIYGTVSARWTTASGVTSKVNATTAYVGARVVVDTSGLTPRAWFEAIGTVSKGAGVGGSLEFVAELDGADPDVAGIIACNQPGYVAPGTGAFYGKTLLNISTGDDAVLSVRLP